MKSTPHFQFYRVLVGTVLLQAGHALAEGPAALGVEAQDGSALIKRNRIEASDAAIQRAVDAVYPALVRIHVVFEEGQQGRMEKRRASGSGVIISEDGYIVTNHHVAGRATRLVCRLSNREEVDAELVGTDPLSDIAVLKLEFDSRRNPDAPFGVARWGDSDTLKVGDVVLAMGSPAGVSQSVTKGIVSNTEMISPGNGLRLDGENVGELVRWIGHDAVIYPGNSGGPLVNLQGEVVGINEVGIGSLGGAIPSNLARQVVQHLIERGHVPRSWIGIEPQPLLKSMPDALGILVASVLPDSPARNAGILPGDWITEYSGQLVQESRSREDLPLFNQLVLSTPLGAVVTLRGVRDGKPMTWTLTTIGREPNLAKEGELREWGLTVRDFTRVSALEKDRADRRGVWVDSVRPGGSSAAAKPELRRDDVIVAVGGEPMDNVAALRQFTEEFVRELEEPEPVLVTFDREGQELATVIRIGPEPDPNKPARPDKGWLGVETQVLTRELVLAFNLEGRRGVRVTQVYPRSPAAEGGLQAGDILLKLDGLVIPARTPSDQELFGNLIRDYKVGTQAVIEGVRDGESREWTVRVGKQPKPSTDLDSYEDKRFEFTAREMSFTEAVNAKLDSPEDGVRLATVQPAGWVALAGGASGDVLLSINGQKVGSIERLKELLKELEQRKPRQVVFKLKRGIYTEFIEVEPKW
ncbi:MAG: PDZ domain-containing protein [Verrucomicrobia bacterium]|jgi:serine protease Do|nr:PDZ domain-containing protein [Verrucomicrobiota bacterium]